ncbi:L,D-transpeptidase family protein [Curvibacter sp. RS43]|uniref:L,D-transpeptidase family protein n=1 Tax=Curvibacter microcysteis TaxID=3026419 RepID=A0ABT5MDS8_9BURK|nr:MULTISPECIES: L,D-transpeptidase family protein [unclassified Curvibacter]MDD0809564.1 L,D-transpeptidase family protein [Curvibacter sp. RS43]MDD0814734.1 L,D-transpeptidase family protein [Curvibacter sp. HBC28]
MNRPFFARCALLGATASWLIGLSLFGGSVLAAQPRAKAVSGNAFNSPAALRDGQAEARLIEIYRLIGAGRSREALRLADALVQEHPNFQLAQLVHGDLLTAQTRPLRTAGDVPDTTARAAEAQLKDLREEARLRLKALSERPPAQTVPSQFVSLSARHRHAIAVDTSRARLYLFENGPQGPKLIADYYISVGKLGIEKGTEGDQRTPLGVYFITSNLDPRTLKDFYGAGALPINYPNPYDSRRGKTGSGIWLHGTPPSQFARAPQSTDGCVVMANPDLQRLLATVEVRATPVVIAPSLQWVPPAQARAASKGFEEVFNGWQAAKAAGDVPRLLGYYTPDFNSYGKSLAEWTPTLQQEIKQAAGRGFEIKDLSLLRWSDSAETMVVTFGELVTGSKRGTTKRQYWLRQGQQWRIFFEGVIG